MMTSHPALAQPAWRADRHDVEVDADAAMEAKQLLDAMPRGAGR
jgi:hypothetical protein